MQFKIFGLNESPSFYQICSAAHIPFELVLIPMNVSVLFYQDATYQGRHSCTYHEGKEESGGDFQRRCPSFPQEECLCALYCWGCYCRCVCICKYNSNVSLCSISMSSHSLKHSLQVLFSVSHSAHIRWPIERWSTSLSLVNCWWECFKCLFSHYWFPVS